MAGHRKGGERRVNHDFFAGIKKWSQLDQARVRELYESIPLRSSVLALIKQIRELAPGIDQGALEALAHGLVRDLAKQPVSKDHLI